MTYHSYLIDMIHYSNNLQRLNNKKLTNNYKIFLLMSRFCVRSISVSLAVVDTLIKTSVEITTNHEKETRFSSFRFRL